VYEKLIKISIENNINNFYICSDSSKFLNFLKEKKLNYVTSLGTPRHIDYPGCTIEGYNKTFEDFLSLRQCKVICYIKGGFAATSALTSGKKAICL